MGDSILPITREPEVCQIVDWWWNINISFHFMSFPRKTNDRIFQKNPKKLYFAAILVSFCPILGKNEFSFKKLLCQFLNIPIIYHRAKNQKKLMSYSWEKCQTDGRTENGNFIGPSIRRGSNNHVRQFLKLLIFEYVVYACTRFVKAWYFLASVTL